MTEPFDLDSLVADGQSFPFKFDGKDYELPADIDLKIVAMLQIGDVHGAMEEMLGIEVWKSIVDSPKVLGVKQFKALLDAYMKHLGVDSLGGS